MRLGVGVLRLLVHLLLQLLLLPPSLLLTAPPPSQPHPPIRPRIHTTMSCRVAMGEGGAAVADMKGKAEQLQAQLRGLIGDYQGGDEAAYAAAFESFDMLSRCLEEQEAPAAPAGVPPAVPATATAPAAVAGSTAPAAVSAPPAEEAPLISFD